MPRVFFITGTSTGFGNNLVQEVLDRGDIAVATARKPESLSFKNTTDKARYLHNSYLNQRLTNSRTTSL
jgi:NAD(P)-dependent dehydrogenase (short-subunit alcohol dehydrogenase family)